MKINKINFCKGVFSVFDCKNAEKITLEFLSTEPEESAILKVQRVTRKI